MPIFWGDYLKNTLHLSAEEHGAYFLLMAHYWMNGGAIKNDRKLIENVCKIPYKKCSNILAFFREDGDRLVHGRIEEEIARAVDNSQKQKARTAAATAARLAKSSNVTSNVTSAVTNDVPSTTAPSPSTTPTEYSTYSAVCSRLQDMLASTIPHNMSIVHQWINAGAIPEVDIYPTVELINRRAGKTFSPTYYDKPILQAIADRTKPRTLPESQKPEKKKMKNVGTL